MLLGKTVDPPVQHDAGSQARRVDIPEPSLDEITHEVAGQKVRIIAGEM
jgi:hypothetical protein